MTLPDDLRAQAVRCRRVGLRYGGHHQQPMNVLAAQLEAQALAIEQDGPHRSGPAGPGSPT